MTTKVNRTSATSDTTLTLSCTALWSAIAHWSFFLSLTLMFNQSDWLLKQQGLSDVIKSSSSLKSSSHSQFCKCRSDSSLTCVFSALRICSVCVHKDFWPLSAYAIITAWFTFSIRLLHFHAQYHLATRSSWILITLSTTLSWFTSQTWELKHS